MLSVDIETSYPKINQPDHFFHCTLCQGLFLCFHAWKGKIKIKSSISLMKKFINCFLVAVKNYNPDALIGWNIVQFDMAFLAQNFNTRACVYTLGAMIVSQSFGAVMSKLYLCSRARGSRWYCAAKTSDFSI